MNKTRCRGSHVGGINCFGRTGTVQDVRDVAGDKSLDVYYYVVATVGLEKGRFVQKGCGPNFDGGVITLCTCKHYMRTLLSYNDWVGKWVAGFSSIHTSLGRNALVYLMHVEQAFTSHEEMWSSLLDEVREAKAADKHATGDLYRLELKGGDARDPRSYCQPRSDHVHSPGHWQQDISYMSWRGHPAALLRGDPAMSFTWSEPTIFHKGRIGRGHRRCSMSEFLERRVEEP